MKRKLFAVFFLVLVGALFLSSITERFENNITGNIITGNYLNTPCENLYDSGNDLFIGGKVRYQNRYRAFIIADDNCMGNTLNEVYCVGNTKSSRNYICTRGCVNTWNNRDYCNKDCSDSDGGINYSNKGMAVGYRIPTSASAGEIFTGSDVCESNNGVQTGYLYEHYCDANGYHQVERHLCENGCKDGKCLSVDFIILTSSTLSDSANRLANLRRSQGIITKIEYIDGKNADTIVQLISNFKNINPTLNYVLLFGDVNTIPTFYSKNSLAIDSTPTDLKYSLPKDNLPTLAVGRITLKDNLQAKLWIDKLELYNSYVPSNDIFLFGSTIEYDAYAVLHKNLIQGYGFNILTYKPSSKSFVADEIRNEAAPVIASEINKGKKFSIFYGHGSSFMFLPVFFTDDIDKLNNKDKPTVIFTGGCDTVDYSNPSDRTLSKRFLLGENGAVAVIGGTKYGGYGYDYGFIPSFFKNCKNKRLGEAFDSALIENYKLAVDNGAQNWGTFFVEKMSLLGDPTMPVC
jgi:hypothetical protein